MFWFVSDEPENIDVADEEQSIGLSIKMKPPSNKPRKMQGPAIFTVCAYKVLPNFFLTFYVVVSHSMKFCW